MAPSPATAALAAPAYPHVPAEWATYDAASGLYAISPMQTLARAPSDWPGLPMMSASLPGDAVVTHHTIAQPVLALARSGRGKRHYRCGLQTRDLYSSPGMFELYGAGFCIDHARWQGVSGEVVGIQFPAPMVNRLLQNERGFELRTAHELFDDRVASLALALWDEAQAGAPRGTLYAQGLTLALLGLLSQQYGACGDDSRRPARLSSRDRALIRDHIEAQLASDLSVEALAAVVRMGPAAFARAFKATFQLTPHAYVLERRIDLASRWLRADRQRALVDVALALGFSSQSHFTDAFRRRMKTTPARWRASG